MRDIDRDVEAARPLPDHHRILLFGEEREVELMWNNATNEVCSAVMPFNTVEEVPRPTAE